MQITHILSVVSACILSSCYPAFVFPHPATVAAQEKQLPRPSPAQVEALIREDAFTRYKDPESLKLRLTTVREFGIARPTNWSESTKEFYVPGYRVTTMLDAKNGRGAYDGYKDYEFLYAKGRLIKITDYILTDNLVWYPRRLWYFHPKSDLYRLRANLNQN